MYCPVPLPNSSLLPGQSIQMWTSSLTLLWPQLLGTLTTTMERILKLETLTIFSFKLLLVGYLVTATRKVTIPFSFLFTQISSLEMSVKYSLYSSSSVHACPAPCRHSQRQFSPHEELLVNLLRNRWFSNPILLSINIFVHQFFFICAKEKVLNNPWSFLKFFSQFFPIPSQDHNALFLWEFISWKLASP